VQTLYVRFPIFVNIMDLKSIEVLKAEWDNLKNQLEHRFDAQLDLQGILFLIGVQELGHGVKNFSKSEKQDLMHIATCKLLSYYGYYHLDGHDTDGWPHWNLVEKLPQLSLKEQDLVLKKSAIRYFEENEFI